MIPFLSLNSKLFVLIFEYSVTYSLIRSRILSIVPNTGFLPIWGIFFYRENGFRYFTLTPTFLLAFIALYSFLGTIILRHSIIFIVTQKNSYIFCNFQI